MLQIHLTLVDTNQHRHIIRVKTVKGEQTNTSIYSDADHSLFGFQFFGGQNVFKVSDKLHLLMTEDLRVNALPLMAHFF